MNVMTLDEIALLLRITLQSARNRLSLGLDMPPSFKVGRRRLFLQHLVERWFAERANDYSCQPPEDLEPIVRGRGRPRKGFEKTARAGK